MLKLIAKHCAVCRKLVWFCDAKGRCEECVEKEVSHE